MTVVTCAVTCSLYHKSKDRESITAYLQYTTYGVSQPVNIINSATLLNELDLSPIKADWRSLDHTFTRSNLLCMGGVRLFAALYKAQYAFPDFLCRHKSEMKNDRTTRFTQVSSRVVRVPKKVSIGSNVSFQCFNSTTKHSQVVTYLSM